MKKIFATIVALMAVAALANPIIASAKGSSHPKPLQAQSQAAGFVPIEQAQRAMHFTDLRVWQSSDGAILVCRWDGEIVGRYSNKECVDKAGKNAWTDINDLKVPGYKIAGYEIRTITNYETHVIVYFKKESTK